MMTTEFIIEIQNLTKKYGSLTAVNNLNIKIPRGQLFGFLGPNGAGKTTTIKILAGLLKPTSGSVKIGGLDVSKFSLQVKKITGYIPDRPFLYEKLTGQEFLEFISRLYEIDLSKAQKKIAEYLTLFRLFDWRNQLIENYSHGMKQKLTMCAAFLHSPELIIVDEPMVGLDPEGALLVKKIFQGLVDEGVTIFMSTHTLTIAQQLCERIVIIQKGTIIADGSFEKLQDSAHISSNELEDVFLELTREENFFEHKDLRK